MALERHREAMDRAPAVLGDLEAHQRRVTLVRVQFAVQQDDVVAVLLDRTRLA
jgi:hypothetical protein